MGIEVGMKCKQIKPIEQYNFNYVGMSFEITSVNENVIMGRNGLLAFGIDKNEFLNYFEIIEEIKKVEVKDGNKVIRNNNTTIVILPDGIKGVSKCSPQNEYDVNKGYKIALLKAEIKQKSKQLKQLCK